MSRYLSVKEFAEMFGMSCGAIYHMIKENKIPHYRIGKKILLDPADFRVEGEKHGCEQAERCDFEPPVGSW